MAWLLFLIIVTFSIINLFITSRISTGDAPKKQKKSKKKGLARKALEDEDVLAVPGAGAALPAPGDFSDRRIKFDRKA